MYKQSILSVIGGALGSVLIVLALFAMATFAAPTQAPPGGNPTFPLTGPEGPEGPEGPAGPPGSSGASASISCTTVSQTFSEAFTTVTCPSGYKATGGGFYLSDGNNNGLNWNNAWAYPWNDNGWHCGRNVYSGNSSVCYVQCCRLQ